MEHGSSTGRVIGALLVLLAACAPALARADIAPLAMTLDAGAAPGEVRVRLVNTGTRPIAVLPAGTPFEPALSADVFRVLRVARRWPPLERAPYRGRRVKRVPPVPGDFVTLAPGADMVTDVALAPHYAVPEAGAYRIAFEGEITVADPLALAAGGAAPPGLRHLRLRAEGPRLHLVPAADGRRARPAAFARCDAARRTALVETTAAAERLVGDALAGLDARPGPALASAPRYTHWFGAWTPARAGRVRSVFTALLDSLSGATLAYDCGCTDPTLYAYVYPARLHDVFVCPAFFRAPLLGRDSRAGTLVHELTHFAAIAATHDHVYGVADVAALARRDPALAVSNADSYEYFAENTPPRPMTGGTPIVDPARAPRDDAPIASLPLDAIVTGTLGAGRLERFTTRGAGSITVDSLAGDADLYLFESTALDTLVCASTTLERSGATEVCPVPNARTVHVVVHAYTDTRYAIRATSSSTASAGAAGDVPAVPTPPAGIRPAADPAPAPSPASGPLPSLAGGGGGGGPGPWILFALAAWRAARPARAPRPAARRRSAGRPGVLAATDRGT